MRMIRSARPLATLLAISLQMGAAVAAPRALPAEPEPERLAEADASPLSKTIVYAGVASLFDLGVGYVVGGGLATGTAIAVVNSASGWLLYHVHERIWGSSAWAEVPSEQLTPVKTMTFTVANGVRLLGLGLAVTGSVAWSAAFLMLNALGDSASYIVTDRIWMLFGPKPLTTPDRS